MTTLDELRNVADKLKEIQAKPVKLTKEQADAANKDIHDMRFKLKEGDVVYLLDKHNPDML